MIWRQSLGEGGIGSGSGRSEGGHWGCEVGGWVWPIEDEECVDGFLIPSVSIKR